jgi:hypothetical protein
MSEKIETTISTNAEPDLGREIAAEIQNNGPISFERYMELALYHPTLGYYERRPDILGKAGDFYTSVSTGPLFGKLLAEQFLSWSRKIDWMDRWVWIEAGAHSGTLARDILKHATHFKLPLPLEYHIIEPSATRRAWQEKTLAGFPQVKWKHSFSDYKEPLAAIIFSNELLDAFPKRLHGWPLKSSRQVIEWNTPPLRQNGGMKLAHSSGQDWLLLWITVSPTPSWPGDSNLHQRSGLYALTGSWITGSRNRA